MARYNALSLRFLRDKQFLTTKLAIGSSFFRHLNRLSVAKKINTYAISSFLDRKSSSRSMESSFGTQHPINAGTRGTGRARSSRWKKSLEKDETDGWRVGGDEKHLKQDLFEGVKMRLQGGMKNVEEREDVGLGTTSYSLPL